MAPVLNSVTPNTGAPGDALTLTGTGFGASAVVRYVHGGQREYDAAPTFVDSTNLGSVAPEALWGLAGDVQVSVINPGALKSNSVSFMLGEANAEVYTLCSLGALKRFLGVALSETIDDEQLKAMIVTASSQIAGYCGREFRTLTYTDELIDGDGTHLLRLKHLPVRSVTALEIDGQTVDAAELKVYPQFVKFAGDGLYNPRLRTDSRIFPEGSQNIKVSYTAGYAAVPPEVALAGLLQVVYLQNVASKQGIVSETNATAQTTTAYAQEQLTPAARAACNRYRSIKVAMI